MESKTPSDLKRLKVRSADPRRGAEGPGLLVHLCGPTGAGKSTLAKRLAELGEPIELENATAGLDLRFAGLMTTELTDALHGACRTVLLANGPITICDPPADFSGPEMMTVAASMSDLTLVVVDAGDGLSHTAHYQALVSAMFGTRRLILAVNRIETVDNPRDRFDELQRQFEEMARSLDLEAGAAVPISAATGDNVAGPRRKLGWYSGSTLLELIEAADTQAVAAGRPFRMVVQSVADEEAGAKDLAGFVCSGRVHRGDEIVALPETATARVERIETPQGAAEQAIAGDDAELKLSNAIAITAGDIVAAADAAPSVSDQVAAHLIWISREPLLPGRAYAIKVGAQAATATVSTLKYKVDADNLDHQAAATLELGEVGYGNLSISRPVVFDAYAQNPDFGAFVLFDKITGAPVGLGAFAFGLWRATNVQWQALEVEKRARADLKGQRPCVLWFTGLSGAGKSTIASLLEKRLHAMGRHTYVLDGDNVRHGLNKDLGFTDADRVENIRRVAETARLFVDAGLIVMVSFISPFRMERRMARDLLGSNEFIEVFVDASLQICEQRDPKGLYKKARAGKIKNFTGIDSAYEAPERADIILAAGELSPTELVEQVLSELKRRALI